MARPGSNPGAIWYTSNMSLDVLFSGRLEIIILSQLVRSTGR